LREGKKIWEFETGDVVSSSPCLSPEGIVYVGSRDHKVYALKDGKKLWEFQTGDEVYSSPCLGPDGTVYVGSCDHKVYALREGKKIWEFETATAVTTSPCLGPDEIIYVGSYEGCVYALRPPRICEVNDSLQSENGEPLKGEGSTEIEIDDTWITVDGVRIKINDAGRDE